MGTNIFDARVRDLAEPVLSFALDHASDIQDEEVAEELAQAAISLGADREKRERIRPR